MKQADIKRLERVVGYLQKADDNIAKMAESLWKQRTEQIGNLSTYEIAKLIQVDVHDVRLHAERKLRVFSMILNDDEN